jgi:hypothetical protein
VSEKVEVIVHSTPSPTVGRDVHIHWQQTVGTPPIETLDHGPVAAKVVGVDASGFWVRTFPPPWYSDFPAHLYLPLREEQNARITHSTIFNLFWRWPPRV